MAALDFYTLPAKSKRIILQATGEKVGLAPYAIEKDWWVIQTLNALFQTFAGTYLLFKGGTSLSKGWGLIDRFSEDIDLALNREFLGISSGPISKSQIKKLRKLSCKYTKDKLTPDLIKSFSKTGFENIHITCENIKNSDQDPVNITVVYPNVLEYPEYIQPRIKIEVGSRSMKEPFSHRQISTWIGKIYSDRNYADLPISIPCVNPERTFWEKLFLLHEEFQKPVTKVRVDRLSRHLYDIYKISHSEYFEKVWDQNLIHSIIQHRSRFNQLKGIKYDSHYPPTLNSLPPDHLAQKWKEDYQKMNESMIFGASPTFEELVDDLQYIIFDYNKLKFT